LKPYRQQLREKVFRESCDTAVNGTLEDIGIVSKGHDTGIG
jgi:hypothetical protein